MPAMGIGNALHETSEAGEKKLKRIAFNRVGVLGQDRAVVVEVPGINLRLGFSGKGGQDSDD